MGKHFLPADQNQSLLQAWLGMYFEQLCGVLSAPNAAKGAEPLCHGQTQTGQALVNAYVMVLEQTGSALYACADGRFAPAHWKWAVERHGLRHGGGGPRVGSDPTEVHP